MPTEQTDFIAGLDQARPQGSESLSEADDHLRLIKKAITGTFVGADGDHYDKPVTTGPDAINDIEANWDDTVRLTTAQVINGVKTFNENVKAVKGVVDGAGDNLIESTDDYIVVGATDTDTVYTIGVDDKVSTHTWNDGNDTALSLNASNFAELMADLMVPVDTVIQGGPDPSLRWPGTTWAPLPGHIIIGTGEFEDQNGKTMIFSKGVTGGEYEHELTIAELPAHTHSLAHTFVTDRSGAPDFNISRSTPPASQTGSVGSNVPHNNLPPYYPVNIWVRTA